MIEKPTADPTCRDGRLSINPWYDLICWPRWANFRAALPTPPALP